jgi:hypothetical protein
MTDKTFTPFSNKCQILADFWMENKTDNEFADFIQYNDLGLPLAYLVTADIVDYSNKVEVFVGETWDLFIGGLGVEDTGFECLADVYDAVALLDTPEE